MKHNLVICVLLSFIVGAVQSQQALKEPCDLPNGEKGQCVPFKECPSAIELVRRNGRPTNCGFDGNHPIVCCESTKLLREIGSISKQKCNETYSGVPPVRRPSPFPILLATATSEKRRKRRIQLADDVIEQVSSEPPPPSIVGGEVAEYPHMAALGFGDWSEVNWACGGSLISDTFILTAAHCINTQLGRVKFVRLGDLDLKSTTDYASPQDFNISRIILHPGYKPPSVYNDIALIELSARPIINDYVRPACLHTETEINNAILIATGWGDTSYGGKRANFMQHVRLREFTHKECAEAFNGTSLRKLKNGIDAKSQLCAGEASKDTCQGDSGGPLQIRNGYNRGHEIIGVTSFGKACGIGNFPGVYTRTSNFIEWIESVVWPNV